MHLKKISVIAARIKFFVFVNAELQMQVLQFSFVKKVCPNINQIQGKNAILINAVSML